MAEERELDLGTPGASARREHARRQEGRERRTLERHPRSGRLLLALRAAPRDEDHWKVGAEGEEGLARALARRCPEVIFLHDRAMPAKRSNIDHIAIAASGVWVIDTKRYRGRIKVSNPLFGEPKLLVDGRDRTSILAGLDMQVAAVRQAMGPVAPDVPVHGCLCFVTPRGPLADSGVPVLRTLTINGYPLLYPRKLARRLNRRGPLDHERARVIAAALAESLPAR